MFYKHSFSIKMPLNNSHWLLFLDSFQTVMNFLLSFTQFHVNLIPIKSVSLNSIFLLITCSIILRALVKLPFLKQTALTGN